MATHPSFTSRFVFHSFSGKRQSSARRACDACRARKIRCMLLKNGCKACQGRGKDCTFEGQAEQHVPTAKPKALSKALPKTLSPKESPSETTRSYSLETEDAQHPAVVLFLPTPDFSMPHFRDLDKYCLSAANRNKDYRL